ncbi:hypothetical protein CPB85DRAFT_1441988 [Mucidula mucida]|nr:hypothetical protein CPB85DRAFT_1441988 [Mucidula mucida]
MRYFDEKTTIPLPGIICYNASSEEAGHPYIVTTKVKGIALIEIWDDLSDERRDVILRQVAEIVVEMYSQRFDKIGTLSARGEWVIKASPQQSKIGDHIRGSEVQRRLRLWWMRSLIPSFYDDSLDVDGFPLIFHSQNFFILWDDTRTLCTSSFAQPPFFMVDHPMDDLDNEKAQVKSRKKARDREVYTRLVGEEEVRRFPNRPPKLLKWEGVYLFEQCIDGGVFYSALWNTLVEHVVGDQKDAQMEYFFAMIESGILKSVSEELARREKFSNRDVDLQ